MKTHRFALVVAILAGTTARADSGSALADAVEKKATAAVIALLEKGADVNIPQADGTTALHWAVYHDDLPTAALLIRAGANAAAENQYGVRPVSLACTNGNAELVEALLKAGADANTTLPGGETALLTAARTGKPSPVKVLLAHKADVNGKDRKGQTALMWAAADGHAAVVEALIAAGADFRTPLPSGFTPLHFAAREGRIDVVRALLKAGADVNEPMQVKRPAERGPRNGTSALILAVENGHFELAVHLLKAGADPNDQRAGFGALHMLSWVRKPDRGDGETGVPPPIGSGKVSSLEFVRKMASHGADVNLPLRRGVSGRGILSMPGATPFLAACSTADLDLMRALLDVGADPKIPNAEGSTPLLAATGIGLGAPEEAPGSEAEVLEAVELLLKLGADINASDNNGETVMHGAAYRHHAKVVQLLAAKGAQIAVWNRESKQGYTALMIAEGYRLRSPINFRPSKETVAALHRVMIDAGVTPPTRLSPPGVPMTDSNNRATKQADQ
jgi:ankyrin repeat protein